MRSLKGRLTLLIAVSLVALLAMQAVGLRIIPGRLVEEYVVSRLEHDEETIYARLVRDETPEEISFTVGIVYDKPLSGHYFLIDRDGTTIRSRSLWDEDLPSVRLPPGGRNIARILGPGGQPLLIFSRGHRIGGETVTITVAEEVGEMERTVATLERRLFMAAFIAIVFALVLQFLIIRRGLRPLDEAVDACRRLEAGEVSLVDSRAPREIAPVVEAINRLIHHHGHRLERTRRALGNVGHALKTPLAVLTHVADDAAGRGDAATAGVIRVQVEAMRGTVERELRRARLAGTGHPGTGFDACAELSALAEVVRRMGDGHVAIELDVRRAGRLPFDTEDMVELFGNLMDNGRKWARSRVRVTVLDAPGLEAVVEDDGPGVAEDDLPLLGTAGMRLDEERPGHGLGLAIVRDIVSQYGGEISYGRSEEYGGLRVAVAIPMSRQ